MKKPMIVAMLIALPTGLAGCDKKAEAPKADAPMANMAMRAKMKTGTGTGIVTAINAKAGTITLDHGPIDELQWPPMKMGFGAKGDVLKGIAVGDKVTFEIEWNGSTGQVTTIKKR